MSDPVPLATAAPGAASGAAATGAAASGAAATPGLAGDLQSFLKLLTTQLRNQDPLQPTDSTQFVTQLAMFAQAEQGVNTNNRLDSIIEMVRGRTLADAAGLLGRTVEAASDRVSFDGTAPARFAYTVPDGARSVSVRVLDAGGTVVRSVEGAAGPGLYEDAWDGRTDAGGVAPEGDYALEVMAELAPERPGAGPRSVGLPTSVRGRVEEVRVADGRAVAVVAGREVPVEGIASVGGEVAPGAATAATALGAAADGAAGSLVRRAADALGLR